MRSRWLELACAGGVILSTCVALTTTHVLPTPLHPSKGARLAWECVVMELLLTVGQGDRNREYILVMHYAIQREWIDVARVRPERVRLTFLVDD